MNKGIRVRKYSGQTTVVSRADRSAVKSASHHHLYQGGHVGGVYFDAGYYPYPFWMLMVVGTVDVDDKGQPLDQNAGNGELSDDTDPGGTTSSSSGAGESGFSDSSHSGSSAGPSSFPSHDSYSDGYSSGGSSYDPGSSSNSSFDSSGGGGS